MLLWNVTVIAPPLLDPIKYVTEYGEDVICVLMADGAVRFDRRLQQTKSS